MGELARQWVFWFALGGEYSMRVEVFKLVEMFCTLSRRLG